MKTILLALALFAGTQLLRAQGTAFTYQGRLSDGTNAANGIYDLRFSLYDTSVGGHGNLGLLTNTATLVSNGLFTVTLDFGSGIFAGDACWLGLGVRTNGGASFTTLSPRQQLTATPYAILASGVGAGDITANMLSSGAVTSDKIATGAVKSYQIDDGGSAAYEGFQAAAQKVGSDTPLPFASLYLVASTNILKPTFSLSVNGGSLGTVVGFSGSEGISRPYAYVVEVQASGTAIDPDAQLGLTATLAFTRNGRTTSFGGIVTACTLSGAGTTGLLYTVRIEPPLASLALTTDYKVNQNLKAYEAAANLYRDVIGDSPTLSLTGSYVQHENLIQYAETDLNFFNRLLEYEGIFYLFNQSASPPSLILGDSSSAYLSAPNSPFVYYGDTTTNVPSGADYIRTFQKADHQSTLKSSVNAYDFTRPRTALLQVRSGNEGVGEHYEFGTPIQTAAYIQKIAQVRVDRQAVERAAIAGSGTAPDLRPGYTFALTDQTGAGLGGTYLVTDVRHAGFVRVTNGVSTLFYGNQFQAIPATLPYRPALQTPKPQALPCTAIITGPSGEEIYTDQYGRVKVQFHWDRYGAKDETSSAWLRQTSPMASGSGRGMLFLPRIGDEVLVSFIQGDPDQPVITGSLYNGVNGPAYNLPGQKTVSTIRSTGSKGQPDAINEIKFDDLASQQTLDLKAARDMNINVAHDLEIHAANDLVITAAGNLIVQANTLMKIEAPLTLTGNLYLPITTAGAGGIYLGGVPVIQSLAGGNFFAGPNAGNLTMGGSYNTAVGSGALEADTTGANNTAYGYGALGTATTGSENTASGVNALYSDLNGKQNVANGVAALYNNTSGDANTAVGYEALITSSSGSRNTANGYMALCGNASGNNNIALGYQAGFNIIGHNNIDLGNQGTAFDNGIIRLGTPGTHTNTFIAGTIYGNGGGLTNLSASALTGSASNLTLTGTLYLPNTTAGAGGVYFGGAPVIRSLAGGNFFAGLNAGNATMSGNFNTAVGATALDADTTGANNTAYGYGALGADTTGSENTASGVNALTLNVNGNQNTAQGAAALYRNTSGCANTVGGYEAMFNNTSGSNNTAHGYKALFNASTGSNNIALGYQAGYNLTTGNNNIDVGNQGTSSDNGVIRIGTSGTHNTTLLTGNVGIGKTNPATALDVNGTITATGFSGTANNMSFDAANDMNLTAGNKLTIAAAGNLILHGSTISLANTVQAGTIQASGNLYMNDQDIHWRGDSYHGAGWYGAGKPFAGATPDGPVLYGYSGGGLGTVRGTVTNLALYWNYSGNVGIGTNSANYPLTLGSGAYCSAAGVWTSVSDRNAKEDFTPITPGEVLAKVAALPITQWKYKAEAEGVKHIGPVAQDFHAAFGLGADDKHIADVDEGGVALAAIQGLNEKVETGKQKAESRMEKLEMENAALKTRLERLEQLLSAKNGGEL